MTNTELKNILLHIEDKDHLKEVRNALNTIIWEKEIDYNDVMYLLSNSISSLEYVKNKIINNNK